MAAGDPALRRVTIADLIAAEHAGRRCEIIAGSLVDKEAGGRRHAGAQGAVTGSLFHRFGGGSDEDRPGGWVFLVEATIAVDAENVLTPDISGWRRERAPTTDDFPIAVPSDWACEIVNSSHSRDLGEKPPLFHAIRVGHYWVLDLKAEMLTVYRWADEGYVWVTSVPPSATVRLEPFAAVEFKVWELFGLAEPPPAP